MEWLKLLGILFGWLSSLFAAFRWGKHIGLIENQMQIEDITCNPPATKYRICNKPVRFALGAETYSFHIVGKVKVKLIFHRGKITEVICDYLNRQTSICEWCEEKLLPCKYYPKKTKKKGLKGLLTRLFCPD